jgi:hypothetical protein
MDRDVRMALKCARPRKERWEELVVYKFKPYFFIARRLPSTPSPTAAPSALPIPPRPHPVGHTVAVQLASQKAHQASPSGMYTFVHRNHVKCISFRRNHFSFHAQTSLANDNPAYEQLSISSRHPTLPTVIVSEIAIGQVQVRVTLHFRPDCHLSPAGAGRPSLATRNPSIPPRSCLIGNDLGTSHCCSATAGSERID